MLFFSDNSKDKVPITDVAATLVLIALSALGVAILSYLGFKVWFGGPFGLIETLVLVAGWGLFFAGLSFFYARWFEPRIASHVDTSPRRDDDQQFPPVVAMKH